MLGGCTVGEVQENVRIEEPVGHHSYMESRWVAARGSAGLWGRFAIHSSSPATRCAGSVAFHQSSAAVGWRRRITASPHGSTVNREPGCTWPATPAGTTSAPLSSAWMTCAIDLYSIADYRRFILLTATETLRGRVAGTAATRSAAPGPADLCYYGTQYNRMPRGPGSFDMCTVSTKRTLFGARVITMECVRYPLPKNRTPLSNAPAVTPQATKII